MSLLSKIISIACLAAGVPLFAGYFSRTRPAEAGRTARNQIRAHSRQWSFPARFFLSRWTRSLLLARPGFFGRCLGKLKSLAQELQQLLTGTKSALSAEVHFLNPPFKSTFGGFCFWP
jgi:hypothetical protein